MRAVPPAYYFDFQKQTKGTERKPSDMAFLLNSDDYVRRAGITVSEQDRLALLGSLAAALSRLHALGTVVGDLSPKNVLFSLGSSPSCFLIDCDAVQLRGVTVLDQVETPDWEAPAGETRATQATDSYKLGLLAIRLFARDQSSRDATALAAASPELGRLARLSLSLDPDQRPAPGMWIPALGTAGSPAADSRATAAAGSAAGPSRISVPIPTVSPTPVHPRPPAVTPRAARQRTRTGPGGALLLVTIMIALLAAIGTGVYFTHRPAATPLAHSCLVGTWRDGKEHFSINWHGHKVAMNGGAGNVDHIFASGEDHDTWNKARPFYGNYQGHKLKEIIRGHNTLAISKVANSRKLLLKETGWDAGATNTYTYEGQKSQRYLKQSGGSQYIFRCTAHKLIWRQSGHTVDTENRISRKP